MHDDSIYRSTHPLSLIWRAWVPHQFKGAYCTQGLSQQGDRVSFWHPGIRKIPILGGKDFWSEFSKNINYK